LSREGKGGSRYGEGGDGERRGHRERDGNGLGAPFAPEAETVMVPEYEPAEREEEFTETETVPELEPDAGETESQVWLPETVHESVPCPTFETEKD